MICLIKEKIFQMSIDLFQDVIDAEKFKKYKIFNGVWIKENYLHEQGYASNFGLQWNKFKLTQFDSNNGTSKSNDRLFGCSGWSPESLKNKFVLEIGSGAGRFTEILLKYGAKVISIDMSNATFANYKSNNCDRLLIIKESLYNLPLEKFKFDFVLCYGVVQHTPDVKKTYKTCISFAKENGSCSFDHYEKLILPNPFYHPKYLWRPLTKNMDPNILLRFIQIYVPFYFPIDTFIKRIPKIGSYIAGSIPIPCWNYTGSDDINQNKQNLIEWAIMDTFDALGARYDKPWSLAKLNKFAKTLPVKGFHSGIGGNGIILNTFGNLNKRKVF